VDQVPEPADAKVAPDRPRLRLVRHRPADHPSDDRDRVRPLEREGGHRAGGDELDEPVVEVLARVDGVMLLRHRPRNGEEPEADDLEALALESADDLADQPSLDGIGLGEDEGALHGERGS
jgi:hypothetical protein